MTHKELIDELFYRINNCEISIDDILDKIDDQDIECEFNARGIENENDINQMSREQIEQYLKENFKGNNIDELVENVYYDYVERSKHLTKSLDKLFLTINKHI